MNRTIKFRVWNTISEKMLYGEDLYDVGSSYIELDAETGKFFELSGQGIDEAWRVELDNLIPLEYTGLKDCNGKEIYEGDIVRDLYNDEQAWIDSIVFVHGCFDFNSEEHPSGRTLQELIIKGMIEVIGNIYENPELFSKGNT